MIFTIEILKKEKRQSSESGEILDRIKHFKINTVSGVKKTSIYWIKGNIDKKTIKSIIENFLLDPVEYKWRINPPDDGITILPLPGVMDPVAITFKELLSHSGYTLDVITGRRYYINGNIAPSDKRLIIRKVLMNPLIERELKRNEIFTVPSDYKFSLKLISISNMNNEKLIGLSKANMLSLNLKEMQRIQNYYAKLDRKPTDIEMETIAQTWSEHCIHKTFKSPVKTGNLKFKNLIKDTIMRTTKEINPDYALSVFDDNAGAIAFDKNYAITFKVETHNHPSALEPYGGAATGIGGVIRDTLGMGLGAKPIANTDVFCFAPSDIDDVPDGVLHPKRIIRGVVAGVRDYGNRMGIPTVNGAICFDESFIGNPLVYAGSVGIIPRKFLKKQVKKEDLIVLIGGNTGRDGIHGVTFASQELDEKSEKISSGAVQIGNPIEEKKMMDALLKARDEGLYNAITDCGGGGLSSAVGEMGENLGVEVQLKSVPLKYSGLTYTEIWISESQERMTLSIPPENFKRFKEIMASEGVKATVIGKFTGDKKLRLFYGAKKVAELEMSFLHKGPPKIVRRGKERKIVYKNIQPKVKDYNEILLKLLSSPNIASKEWVVSQYDYEVQGGSVLKPLPSGISDAAVIRPIFDSKKAVIIANGINPDFGKLDPYWMSASVIDEALRNLIAVGGKLKGTAILDNFSFGNTDDPYIMGDLTLSAKACYDIATGYGIPFISGKDSLHNEYEYKGSHISIPPTLLISSIGIMEDYKFTISQDFKKRNNLIYLIGNTYPEFGGSQLFKILNTNDGKVPRVYVRKGKKIMNKISKAVRQNLIVSMHDLSEGGLAVALSEMAFSGGIGADISVKNIKELNKFQDSRLSIFSESNTRFLVEIQKDKSKKFESLFKNLPLTFLGKVGGTKLKIRDEDGKRFIDISIEELKKRWSKGIKW